jgi:hypothetical protein
MSESEIKDPQERAAELAPASTLDFERVRDAFIDLAAQPDAEIMDIPHARGVRISLRRFYAVDGHDADDGILEVYVKGQLRDTSKGQRFVMRVCEKVYGSDTSATVNHDYRLESSEDVLTEFTHGINMGDVVPEIAEQLTDLDHKWQADLGRRRLMTDLGDNQELTAGDCDVLVERLDELALQPWDRPEVSEQPVVDHKTLVARFVSLDEDIL